MIGQTSKSHYNTTKILNLTESLITTTSSTKQHDYSVVIQRDKNLYQICWIISFVLLIRVMNPICVTYLMCVIII